MSFLGFFLAGCLAGAFAPVCAQGIAAVTELESKCVDDYPNAAISSGAEAVVSSIEGMTEAVRRYYECEAFRKDNPNICDQLIRYQKWRGREGASRPADDKQDDFRAYCRGINKQFIIIRLNVTEPSEAKKLCEELPFTPAEMDGHSAREECEWMLAEEPGPGCGDPISPRLSIIEVQDCLAYYVYQAREKGCASIARAPRVSRETQAFFQTRCREASAYRKAYEAKDAGFCGNSLTCRMLMGDKVCGRYLDDFSPRFCRFWAEKKNRGRKT